MYYTRKFEDSGGVFHAKPYEMICDLEDVWQIIETFLYDFLPTVILCGGTYVAPCEAPQMHRTRCF